MNRLNLAEVRRYSRRWAPGRKTLGAARPGWASLPVLAYHGAVPSRPFYLNTLFLTAAALRDQLKLLRKRFHFVHPMETTAVAPSGKTKALLSFDDGFANNLHIVAPVLKELGIPALFFVCGDGRGDILYTDALAILKRLGPSHFHYLDERFQRKADGYFTADGKSLALYLRGAASTELEGFIEACEPFIKQVPEPYWRLMNTEELRELSSHKQFCLGSHGMYHQDMRLIPADVLLADLKRSSAYLSSITGMRSEYLSFPFGAYDPAVLDVALQAGFSHCFTTVTLPEPADKAQGRMINNPYVSHRAQHRAFVRGYY